MSAYIVIFGILLWLSFLLLRWLFESVWGVCVRTRRRWRALSPSDREAVSGVAGAVCAGALFVTAALDVLPPGAIPPLFCTATLWGAAHLVWTLERQRNGR